MYEFLFYTLNLNVEMEFKIKVNKICKFRNFIVFVDMFI